MPWIADTVEATVEATITDGKLPPYTGTALWPGNCLPAGGLRGQKICQGGSLWLEAVPGGLWFPLLPL